MIKRVVFFILLLPAIMLSQSYPAKPSNYVTDETGTLTAEQQELLNLKCKAFEDSTSNQIFVYITKSLNDHEMMPLCQEIFHNWKIGQKGKNNGVLIAIFIDDHKFRIHTGYGLEGALPDVLTKRIQEEDMVPHFKNNDYYAGIDKGINKLIYYSSHEYKPEKAKGKLSDSIIVAVMYGVHLLMLIVIFIKAWQKNKKDGSKKRFKMQKKGAKYATLIAAVIFFFLPCVGSIGLLIIMVSYFDFKTSGGGGSSYSGSSDSYSSSSSWDSSDSSSSDFGGGGGGDSGGGGSDSKW